MSDSYSSPRLDAAFNALANGKRRGMINSLAYRPATVSQLAEEFQLTLPAMHKHIKLLEKAKLIRRKKVGRVNFVALNHKSLQEAQVWINKFHTYWASDDETLENYIASMEQ